MISRRQAGWTGSALQCTVRCSNRFSLFYDQKTRQTDEYLEMDGNYD